VFVITADQVGSRTADDAAEGALDQIGRDFAHTLALPPDRTAGDEIQAATRDAAAAYRIVLALTRDGRWSVGLGVGTVREPLARSTRASTGNAFFAARAAIEAAKRAPLRFALRAEAGDASDPAEATPDGADPDGGPDEHPETDRLEAARAGDLRADTLRADDVEALMGLVLALRDRRRPKGWQVHDLLETGSTQSEIARTLGISQGAVSMRASTAASREEFAASAAIVRLLGTLHERVTRG
jgi:hypothetical protein